MSKKEKTRPVVEMRTEDDYINAELLLSQAMGLNPKKFDKTRSPPFSAVVGAWLDKDGNALPAWARDNGAAFTAMAKFQCYPGPYNDGVFIQWGIDLESVDEPFNRHASVEAGLRYAITLAATECANIRR